MRMSECVRLFKALGDETRLRMLLVLSQLGELCACDLESGLDVTQSRASRHLATLRDAGVIQDRRDGTWLYYRPAEPMPAFAKDTVAAFVRTQKSCSQARADLKKTREERRSPCCD